MDKDQIRRTAEKIVREVYRKQEAADLEEGFVLLGQDGVFDSLAALRLVLAIEKEFGIVVEDQDIRAHNFKDFEALYQYLEKKLL